MAVSVATFCGDPLALESPKRAIQPPKILQGDRNALTARIRALVGFWENVTSSDRSRTRSKSLKVNVKSSRWADKSEIVARDLYRPYQRDGFQREAPPCYEDCICDSPPDYTSTDNFATAQNLRDVSVVTRDCTSKEKSSRAKELFGCAVDVKVDLSDIENIRSHANKKAKKAAKAAQRDKWADSDNEEKKEEGGEDAGEGNGDGGAGGAGGDGGGDPPGGGDDDDDWWNTGKKGKKNKKKSVWLESRSESYALTLCRKNPWEELEEEEEKKKEEEAKKAEEEAAAGAGAGEADPMDGMIPMNVTCCRTIG